MIFTLCGALGSVVIVGVYLATLKGWLRTDSPLYPALNLLGTALLSLGLVRQWNLGAALNGLAFGGVSLWGLFVTLRQRIGLDLLLRKREALQTQADAAIARGGRGVDITTMPRDELIERLRKKI